MAKVMINIVKYDMLFWACIHKRAKLGFRLKYQYKSIVIKPKLWLGHLVNTGPEQGVLVINQTKAKKYNSYQ